MKTNLNLYSLPDEVTILIDSFFPKVYGFIDKERVLEHLTYTVLGLAEYYLDSRPSTTQDIKLIPMYFKWMVDFYTFDEMERLFISIQLCETIRRYKAEFKLITEDIVIYRMMYSKEPTLKMTGQMDHILLSTNG